MAGLTFDVAGAAHLPFDDASFDACRIDRVLQHIPDPARRSSRWCAQIGGNYDPYVPIPELRNVMASVDGFSLQFSDRRAMPDTLEGINDELRTIGAGVWPLDLRDQPADIRVLLAKPLLDAAEVERVTAHFLLPRERLLQVVARAGRTPAVPGGGAIATFVANQGYGYPRLYQVQKGVDFSRFDRFHVNAGLDDGGVDEAFQLLSGGGFVIRQRLDGGKILTLRLDCLDGRRGWLGTYSGVRPHIGRISSATVGSKLLVQVFGAAEWTLTLTYTDEPRSGIASR